MVLAETAGLGALSLAPGKARAEGPGPTTDWTAAAARRRRGLCEAADYCAEVERLVGGPAVAEVGREGDAGRVEARVEQPVPHRAELQLLQRRRIVLVHLTPHHNSSTNYAGPPARCP